MQKEVQKLQSLQDETPQCKNHMSKLAKKEQVMIEIEKLQAEMEDNGKKNKAEMLNEEGLNLEIRALQSCTWRPSARK